MIDAWLTRPVGRRWAERADALRDALRALRAYLDIARRRCASPRHAGEDCAGSGAQQEKPPILARRSRSSSRIRRDGPSHGPTLGPTGLGQRVRRALNAPPTGVALAVRVHLLPRGREPAARALCRAVREEGVDALEVALALLDGGRESEFARLLEEALILLRTSTPSPREGVAAHSALVEVQPW